MNINRHNYEEYLLLYVDNELNIVQRKAVESFIAENPDLKAELEILKDSVLPADEAIVFSNKESLLRTSFAPNPVNDTNCEEYFVLYADDELTNEQKDLVEQFVYRNPQYQANFELMQQVKLMPDTAVIFPNKYALYRKEEDDRVPVIPMRWWRMAAAAAILLFIGGIGWYKSMNENSVTPSNNGQVAAIDTNNTKKSASQEPKETGVATNTPSNTQKDQQQALEIAIADQQKKENTQQQPEVKAPVRINKSVDLAVKQDKKQKKNEPQRNILVVPDVQPKEDDVVYVAPEKILKASSIVTEKSISAPITSNIKAPEKGNSLVSTASRPVVEETDFPDPQTTYASTDDKKNKMRGFFRKVSRVFEKTANVDADGKERSGIRIASFEIALK